MKKILLLLGIAFIAVGFFLAWFIPRAWLNTGDASHLITVTLKDGWSASQAADELAKLGIIDSATGFRYYVKLFDHRANFLRTGVYKIPVHTSYKMIMRLFILGPPENELQITIPEGWTVARIDEALAPYDASIPETIPKELRDTYSFLGNLPVGASFEGYLFPDTYRVYGDQLPQSLIKKQLNEFAKRAPGIAEVAARQGRTLRDIVILASIVEKEVSNSNDRKIVAGIFLNRLKDGMPLQSDATVNYVTHAKRTRPTAHDLARDSLYNTYKHTGLPPGPISNPGDDALMAALHPTRTEYRYFLTDTNGKTYFATTFAEHQANRQKAFKN